MDIGQRIKKIRSELKISSAKLASELDIPVRTIGSYERNESVPGAKFLKALIKHYNVNINWLLTGNGNIFISDNGIFDSFKYKISGFNLSDDELNDLALLLNNEAGREMILKIIEIKKGSKSAVDELICNLKVIKAFRD